MDNKMLFSDVLASIYYYTNTFCNVSREQIVQSIDSDLDFWIKNGLFTYNHNRPKMVYDLCKKYGLPNKDFDHVNAIFYDLKRPYHEVKEFYKILS